MGYRTICVETSDRVTTITLNRPEALNALSNAMHWELHEAFEAFASDPEQWVAILTGAGDRAFCAGSDLKGIAAGSLAKPMPPSGYAGLVDRFDLDKPVIAAVNGIAAGGGFEVALACDIIIAARNARFGLPEPKVGLAAGGGGLHNLPRQIPFKLAMGMILTGDLISAEEGRTFGFVNELVEPGDLASAAHRWARRICDCSPLAVRASKHVAVRSVEMPLHDALRQQAEFLPLKRMMESQDAIEGPMAFSQKRKPNWKGL